MIITRSSEQPLVSPSGIRELIRLLLLKREGSVRVAIYTRLSTNPSPQSSPLRGERRKVLSAAYDRKFLRVRTRPATVRRHEFRRHPVPRLKLRSGLCRWY